MTQFTTQPCDFDGGLGQTARIGLIVLQSDQTLEHDFTQLFSGDGVVIHHARIPNAMEVTPESLRDMARDLPDAAALLPKQFGFDAIAYACTSGATMIGESAVAELVQRHHPDVQVTNPLTAAKAAMEALGIKKLALLTPYTADVTEGLQTAFADIGITTTAVASFDQSDDFKVARITSGSILNAILNMDTSDCDAIFISCTSLRTLPIIEAAEKATGKPVLSSNQTLAWHLGQIT
ncbi:MAG: maleate cis-trans isomerase family protein, partial [Planktomarina sp.]